MADQKLAWVRACAVADVPDDRGLRVDLPDTIAIFRLEDGYYALADECSHGQASLAEGYIEDGHVECPLHGACFAIRTGTVLTAPATADVMSHPVDVRGDDIFVGFEVV
jgi:3-phenylpropionate/trans-cinnamate dioxygenase ferredoxin subunit